MEILTFLKREAETKLEKGLLTLRAYQNHMAAVGEHSTDDLYDNLRDAVQMVDDARSTLETIKSLKDNFEIT